MPGPHQKRPFHHDEAIPARIGKYAEQTGCENQERSFHCPVSRHPRGNAPVFFRRSCEALVAVGEGGALAARYLGAEGVARNRRRRGGASTLRFVYDRRSAIWKPRAVRIVG